MKLHRFAVFVLGGAFLLLPFGARAQSQEVTYDVDGVQREAMEPVQAVNSRSKMIAWLRFLAFTANHSDARFKLQRPQV